MLLDGKSHVHRRIGSMYCLGEQDSNIHGIEKLMIIMEKPPNFLFQQVSDFRLERAT
jgi:hypothetical protein